MKAPKFPRPRRPQPIQAGLFQAQANPLLMPSLLEVEDIPPREDHLATITGDDESFLKGINTRW